MKTTTIILLIVLNIILIIKFEYIKNRFAKLFVKVAECVCFCQRTHTFCPRIDYYG